MEQTVSAVCPASPLLPSVAVLAPRCDAPISSFSTAALAGAHTLYENGDPAAARRRIKNALKVHSPAFEQLDLLRFGAGLAAVENDHAEAASMLRDALAVLRTAHKAGDIMSPPDLAMASVECLVPYGHALWRLDETALALQAFTRATVLAQKSLGPEHPETAACYFHLGRARAALGQQKAGVKAVRYAYALCLHHHPSHPVLPRIRHALHRVTRKVAPTSNAARIAHARADHRAEAVASPAEAIATAVEATNAAPLPTGWTQHTAPDGRAFFAHHATKTTTWLDPRRQESTDPSLPSGWEKAVDAHGIPYYIDHNRRTTQRSPPRQAAGGTTARMEEQVVLGTWGRSHLRSVDEEPSSSPHSSRVADESIVIVDTREEEDWPGEQDRRAEADSALPSWQGLQRRGSLTSSVISWESVSSFASAVSSLTRSLSSASLASLSSARAIFRQSDHEDVAGSAPSTPLRGAGSRTGSTKAPLTPQSPSGASGQLLRRDSLFGSFWDKEDATLPRDVLLERAEDEFV